MSKTRQSNNFVKSKYFVCSTRRSMPAAFRTDLKQSQRILDLSRNNMSVQLVFNVDQCDGLPAEVLNPEPVKPRHEDERDATIDEFIAASGCDFRADVGGDRAYYSPSSDFIAMPAFEAFRSATDYYGVAFHELGHWTGHKSRLDRDFSKGRFGDRAYAAEELVAELTAAFLCAEFNLDGKLQHAEYIASWIDLLRDDSRAFFTAASKASAAAQYLRDRALAEPVALAA